MADYDCFPIWDLGPSGPRNVNPKELPLSQSLLGKLEAWAREYDKTLNRIDPGGSGFSTGDQHRRFVDDGRRLALELAQELGPHYEILYFDDLAGNLEKFVQ